MEPAFSNPAEEQFRQNLQDMSQLRRFAGAPAEFWPSFLATVGQLAGAARGILIVRESQQPDRLKKLGEWAGHGHADRAVLAFTQALAQITEECVQNSASLQKLSGTNVSGREAFSAAVLLPLGRAEEKCVAAFLLLDQTAAQARESLLRIQLAADAPISYQLNHAVQQSRSDVEKFAAVLDLLVLVNTEKKFLAAALALCNGIATRFQCDRVSLGWLEHGFIRLRSISRTERFDRQMAAVKSLETAMEEAYDQDQEVVWPAPENSSAIARDHERFAREQTSGNVCSLPLRTESKPVAVLTCERQAKPFSAVEMDQLRLACDQAVNRLADLKAHDRWFGARWTTALQEKCAKLVGPEHTWAKVLAVLGFIGLICLLTPIFTYRVEGKFILRSDEVSYLTAPFDGYIRTVAVRPGDQIKQGQPLVNLDTSDLELDEAMALADQNRYSREAEKARAAGELASMRIAEALAAQAKARLDLVRYRLGEAVIKAPFEGVVVEGDLRQKIGAPVKPGEVLIRVARTDTLYVEAEVAERDVHEILNRKQGEIAFLSQPKWKFPVTINRIEPAAFPKENQNVFVVRCQPGVRPVAWWRPGMSGVAKFDVERRTLLWIITHRTIDFLRLYLWW